MPVPVPINLNDTTPAASAGYQNVKWQADSDNPRNVSAYVPLPTVSKFTSAVTFVADTPLAVTHGLGTEAILVAVYDSGGVLAGGGNIVVTSTTVVTVTFGIGFTGTIVVMG